MRKFFFIQIKMVLLEKNNKEQKEFLEIAYVIPKIEQEIIEKEKPH